MRASICAAALILVMNSSRAQQEGSAEKFRDVSPDGKFALRITYDSTMTDGNTESISREATREIDLVAMPGKTVVQNLGGEDSGFQGKLVWSQDSKWFAYALASGPRVTDTYVYRRSGDKIEEIKIEDWGVDPGGDARNQYVRPLRWLKPATLVLEQYTIFRGGTGDSNIQFTVRFDDKGKFHVISKKKVPAKHKAEDDE